MANDELKALAVKLAVGLGVDVDLVCAIAETESNWNEWAVRFEPAYRYLEQPVEWAVRTGITVDTETTLQKTSWGAMQVMGGVARQYGYNKPLTMLTLPEDGLTMGITHLKAKYERYGGVEKNVIAAYNGGVPVLTNGVYKNQKYVDIVLAKLRDIRLTKKGL